MQQIEIQFVAFVFCDYRDGNYKELPCSLIHNHLNIKLLLWIFHKNLLGRKIKRPGNIKKAIILPQR